MRVATVAHAPVHGGPPSIGVGLPRWLAKDCPTCREVFHVRVDLAETITMCVLCRPTLTRTPPSGDPAGSIGAVHVSLRAGDTVNGRRIVEVLAPVWQRRAKNRRYRWSHACGRTGVCSAYNLRARGSCPCGMSTDRSTDVRARHREVARESARRCRASLSRRERQALRRYDRDRKRAARTAARESSCSSR